MKRNWQWIACVGEVCWGNTILGLIGYDWLNDWIIYNKWHTKKNMLSIVFKLWNN